MRTTLSERGSPVFYLGSLRINPVPSPYDFRAIQSTPAPIMYDGNVFMRKAFNIMGAFKCIGEVNRGRFKTCGALEYYNTEVRRSAESRISELLAHESSSREASDG